MISSSCILFETLIEVLENLGVMNHICHCISHCDHCIWFVMEQGCHNIFDVSRTKKGEKVVENIIYIYIYIIKLIFKNIIDFFFLIHQMKNMGKQINYFWGFLVWIMNIRNKTFLHDT